MSINIEAAAQSMPKSLDSLKETPLIMHRIWFDIRTSAVWYAVMRDARKLYGTNWRTEKRVKRRLDQHWHGRRYHPVWFEVPDPSFATWVAVKHAVIVAEPPGK